jgi:hypothetical protein
LSHPQAFKLSADLCVFLPESYRCPLPPWYAARS